ncbi:OPT superfamily oligopeptide transporter [Aureobasidium pullulans]|uniref:OPT superfamily oligopeptide transporter n=1 Tax=Aureobasidium pullulans TaxID=5580 RepID=A0A4V4KXH6_AURPU|nr:OPT superfamily oligopeptide transporter [Aureobasidium pullulans]THZ69466.1 OPT superfamily oligopeptide transporter [Aureobasidium pullulans]THZ98749.1 OPT superfamily oligopeptide transporter [Aureobasidium pullulans]
MHMALNIQDVVQDEISPLDGSATVVHLERLLGFGHNPGRIESNSRLTETQIMSSAAIGPASSREAQPDPDVKTKGNIETYATDIEAENSSDSEHGADKLLTGEEIKEIIPTEAFKWNVDGDQSPFPEVAACVPNTDDPTTLCNTFRAWFLLTVFVVVFAGANQFFGLRYPSLSIGYVVAQLLVFPIGRAWEKLPRWRLPLGRFSFDINPGKFTIKEHALIVICVNISTQLAYATGSLVAITSPVFWGQNFGAGFSFLFLLSTQMIGFGLAGLSRRWLVYPAALIWPSSLASTVLFRALHEPEKRVSANGWSITRYRFFAYLTILAFVIFWFPDYIWTSLSTFAFITWIFPKNQKVNTIFGMNSGLGLLPISFDWTQINYAGTPLTTPFYITCNAFAVVVLFYLFLSPILYYTNVWNSAYLPLLSSSTFDNTGKAYNVTRVVNAHLDFDIAEYKKYSPMYISMSYSLSYALSFAAVTAVVVHTYLYNGSEIWAKFKNSRHGGEDIHKRLMRPYKEVPDWWYGVLTVIVLGLGILTVRNWDTGLPVWGFIVVCFGMGVVLIIPEGILEGTTNQRVFLNIITELIAGYAWPGKPIANMMVKMYGYNSVKHGLDFAMDLKLGQYMKIPPRVLFVGQLYSSILATAVQVGVLRWMMSNIKDLCSPKNTQRFTCNGSKVVYNASVVWGVIGPQRMFQSGQVYSALMYFFLIGPVVTILVYLLYRRHPNSWLKYINVPIFFNAAGNIPPANTTQYSLWFIFGFVFNFLIRRKAFEWWKKYNYLTQAAMDTGTALATIVIFFALSYHGVKLKWWGNEVGGDTDDANSVPWLKVAKGAHFGKGPGEF